MPYPLKEMVSQEIQLKLTKAASNGDIDALRAAFEEAPTLDVNSVVDLAEHTALHIAAENGQLEAVTYLLGRGADPRCTNGDGYGGNNVAHIALMPAMDHGVCLSILQILLEKDRTLIDLRNKEDGFTCLHLAAMRSKPDVVAWLLEQGADTTIQSEYEQTAWDSAIDRLIYLAFYPDPDLEERIIDSFCAFLRREVRLYVGPSKLDEVYMRKVQNLEVYRPLILSRIGLFALLEHLSQRNVLEQSCQQIRRELCHFILTRNNHRCREPSCIFETHSRYHRKIKDIEPDGVGKEGFYSKYSDIPPTGTVSLKRAHAAGVSQSLPRINGVAASHSQPDQGTLDATNLGSSGPNYLSLVIPFIFTESKSRIDRSRSERREYLVDISQKFQYCKGTMGNLVEFNGALTLDEYSYPTLGANVLKQRNGDQTLMRRKAWELPSDELDPNVIMVDQIWVWQIQEKLIFARLGNTEHTVAVSHADIFLTSYGQVGAYLANSFDSGAVDLILDKFQTSIVKLAEEVGEYAKLTGVESIGIDTEKGFFHEINDIREELSMIRRVVSQQEEVWRDFASNAWPEPWADCLSGRPNYQSTNAQSDKQRQDQREIMKLIMRPRMRIQKWQRRIAQLDEDAERVERSVGIQLDLKQKHTSLQEAHATAVMSAAVFGFSVITIIFTPLSFVMSLFALPIDRFQDSQIPSRWTSDAGMYSTTYIGTWAATAEIVSVTLTLAATLLALEYGLKYRITMKTWEFLKLVPNGLKLAHENLKKTLKRPQWALLRNTMKDKDEENRDAAGST